MSFACHGYQGPFRVLRTDEAGGPATVVGQHESAEAAFAQHDRVREDAVRAGVAVADVLVVDRAGRPLARPQP